jgi:hypothetical protein
MPSITADHNGDDDRREEIPKYEVGVVPKVFLNMETNPLGFRRPAQEKRLGVLDQIMYQLSADAAITE